TNDFEDLGKLQPKADIGIFIGPDLHGLTSGYISSGLVLNQVASTSAKPHTKNEWDFLFQPMFDEYFNKLSAASNPISAATLPPPNNTGTSSSSSSSSSTSIDKDAPSLSTLLNIETTNSPLNSTNVETNEEVRLFDSNIYTNPFAPPETSSTKSSSQILKQSRRIIKKKWKNLAGLKPCKRKSMNLSGLKYGS
ncbi:hypothetical protein Tco_0102309, partial [Tanacetum coccineum]